MAPHLKPSQDEYTDLCTYTYESLLRTSRPVPLNTPTFLSPTIGIGRSHARKYHDLLDPRSHKSPALSLPPPQAVSRPSRLNTPATYPYVAPPVRDWPSRDPIGERGGINLYGFVYNSPLGWIDILGGYPWGNRVPPNSHPQRQRQDSIDRSNAHARKQRRKGGSSNEGDSATFTFYIIDESKPASEAECEEGDVDFEATASTNLPRIIEPSTSTASTLLQIAGVLNEAIGVLSNSPPGKVLDAVDNTQNVVTGLQTMLSSTGVLFEILISARYRCCKCRYSIGGPDWHWSEYKSLGPVNVQSELTGDLWGTRLEMAAGMVKSMQDTISNLRAQANEACNPSETQ